IVAAMTISGGTTLTVNGALLVSGTNGIELNTGDIHAKGSITFSNTSAFGGGNATLTINGTSGNQTFTGNATAGNARVPHVVINKTSDTLILVSTISAEGNWTWTAGPIKPGTSTVYFIGSHTVSGSHKLANVTKTTGSTWTIASGTTLTVGGTFTVVNANSLTINTGTIAVEGNIDLTTYTHSTGGGTGTILINGTGNQTFTGTPGSGDGRLPNITINKTSGTLSLVACIFCAGDWTYTAGTINYGTSLVQFRVAGANISGTHELYSVTFYGDAAITYTLSGTLTVNGTLTFNGTNTLTMTGGTIHAKGNITTTNTGTSTTGTTSIIINGDGNQTLTGSGTAGAGKLPNITIDKTLGNLTLVSIISVTGNWVYVGGTVIPGTPMATSTVAFYGSFNVDGEASGSVTMPFYNVAINSGTRTLTGNLDVDNDFTIASGATCSAGSNRINVGGDWNSQGTWTYGTSTVIFDGLNHNRILGVAGTINFASVEVNRNIPPVPGTPLKSLRLLNPVLINTGMILAKGRIITTSSNYLAFADNATCTVTNDDSAYVHGPVRKTGNDAFSFPLGDTTLHDSIAHHPLAITAPGSASDRFEAQYYAVVQTAGSTIVDSLVNISSDEYWRLDRQVGSSNIVVTLGWNRNSGNVTDYNTLRVGNWDNTQWLDLGNAGVTVSGATGTVQSFASPTYVSGSALLTIANKAWTRDYAVLHRKLDGGYYLVKNGALYFMYDEEYNDTDDDLSFTIYDEQRRVVASSTGAYAIVRTSDYGDNRFFINLFDCATNTNGSLGAGTFILEVTNEKNEKWLLRFKHVTTISPNCDGGGSGEE
ncbi:MAG TPA: hypothetical protein VK826_14455, partial [Bacteroidia bacterium]|nr:hypothetical protein [Bacteroidia bacterium]